MNNTYNQEVSNMILNTLKKGADNATRKEMLVTITGLNERTVRKIIADLRASGIPIISNTNKGGYYLPATQEEAQEYISSMENRAINTFKSVKATKEWLKKNRNINIQLDI